MASLNKILLIGNLGKDPEIRTTTNGQNVASFSLATTENFTKDGQKHSETEWHSIVAWGKLAELAEKFLKKGKEVYIEGKIKTRSWDDKDGVKRYKTEIVASAFQFLGSNEGKVEHSKPVQQNSESSQIDESELPF